MMGRFFLPHFDFELDVWQQSLKAGEATLEEVLQALLDHIQPIVQPEMFAPSPSEAEAEALDGEETPDDLAFLIASALIRTTAIATRLDGMDQRLSRIESGIARIDPHSLRALDPLETGSF